MIWIDYAIIGLIGLSAAVGLMRGFVREAFSLALWMVAVWVGLTFGREFSVYLEGYIGAASGRIAGAFIVLFLVTLLIGGFVGFLIGKLVDMTGLTGTDHVVGLLFGVTRGAVIVSVLVLLAGITPLPEDAWWKESTLIPPFQRLSLWLREQLPAGLAGYVTYR